LRQSAALKSVGMTRRNLLAVSATHASTS
jgi:hypothetical protein